MNENSSFSEQYPLLQIAWDSVSLGLLKECPRKYFITILLSTTGRDGNIHLTFGILYHQAIEAYDRARAAGKPHHAAKIHAVRTALNQSWNKQLGRPWISGDNYKNRFTLVRSVVWYLAQYENDPMRTVILPNGKPAVELSFRYATSYISPDGNPYILCGHLDRLATLENMTFILDKKTSKYQLEDRWFEQFSPNNQMSGYAFAGKIVYKLPTQGVMIDGAQVLVNSTRFKRGFAHRTDSQLNEWYEEVGYWLSQAAFYAQTERWPMNDTSCDKWGGCEFRGICNRAPEVRSDFLNNPAKYAKRSWDPLKIRGDV
jgi:hypothetical protein